MTKNTLHYNYNATVREICDLAKEEALTIVLHEQNQAKLKNHAVILTSKDYKGKAVLMHIPKTHLLAILPGYTFVRKVF